MVTGDSNTVLGLRSRLRSGRPSQTRVSAKVRAKAPRVCRSNKMVTMLRDFCVGKAVPYKKDAAGIRAEDAGVFFPKDDDDVDDAGIRGCGGGSEVSEIE